MVHLCKKCGILKKLDQFYRNKSMKTGRDLRCSSCKTDITKTWRKENPEMVRAAHKKWRKSNPNKIKKYRLANQDQRNSNAKKWRLANPDKSKENYRAYAKKYPERMNARNMKRQAQKLKASPPWLTKEHYKQIEGIYAESQRLKEITGISYNVDHIVPLQGKNVCGLHVPWNLQVITMRENCKKNNKF